MRVLLMAQHYAPEDVSGAVLATELAEGLVQRGHDVTFITSAPNYPYGKVFPGYQNLLRTFESRNGVKIIRVWSHITPSKNFWWRIWNFATFSVMAFFGGLSARKPEVIFSYSPPLPLGLAAWRLSRWWHVPWILRVEDLYPDAAIAAGALRNHHAISLFKRLEEFLYRKASHISLISDGFRKKLLAKGLSDEKLSVTPVWADPDVIHPLSKENDFRREHGMQGKFVILYAGNMGLTSSLEDVIEAAVFLQKHHEISFLFVGEGVKKNDLMRQAHGLGQVIFLPFQPRAMVAELFAIADMSLVTLNAGSSPYSLPSKVFSIMASGRPLLAITPQGSEVAQLLELAQCGFNVQPGDSNILAKKILELKNAPHQLEIWGENGRSYLLNRYSRQRCLGLYESTLKRVIA